MHLIESPVITSFCKSRLTQYSRRTVYIFWAPTFFQDPAIFRTRNYHLDSHYACHLRTSSQEHRHGIRSRSDGLDFRLRVAVGDMNAKG